jgi:hypothetical protein
MATIEPVGRQRPEGVPSESASVPDEDHGREQLERHYRQVYGPIGTSGWHYDSWTPPPPIKAQFQNYTTSSKLPNLMA